MAFSTTETDQSRLERGAREVGCAELADSESSRLRHAVWIALLIVAVAGWVVWRVV